MDRPTTSPGPPPDPLRTHASVEVGSDASGPRARAEAPAAEESDTRTRLLDAAERLFAERTYSETSLRAITTAAGANLAAVNYHFGSKERLFRAVFHRRV